MANNHSPETHRIPYALAGFGLLIASICFGCVPYFSRSLTEQGLAPHAVAFYRYVIAALMLSPILLTQKEACREVLWGLAAGAFMGLGWIGYVTALETVPASTVGVLYMTYPVFTVVIAWLLFADKPTGRAVLATGLIIVAAILASSPASVPTEQLPALVISLAAPFGFGFGICVLVHRLSRIAPLARIASVSLGAMLGLLPLMLTSEIAEVVPEGRTDWLFVAGIAIVTSLVPQLIYTICAPLVGTTRTAVIGSIELPTMFAVGVIAFGESVNWPQSVACMLIIGAIVITRSRATQNVTTTVSKT